MENRTMKASSVSDRAAGVCELASQNRKLAVDALAKAEKIRDIIAGDLSCDNGEMPNEPSCLLNDLRQGGSFLRVLDDTLCSILEILG